MNIIICGAGEVGRHAAEVLADVGSSITIIDRDAGKLAELEQLLDVRSLIGNAAQADVLIEAGVDKADLFLAATNIDEINLLSASIAKGVGARRCIARVHHSAYFEKRGLDYDRYLGIDELLCPEYVTAVAIAQTLRSPGALAVERFARGQVEMQQLPISTDAPAVGKPLLALDMPRRARVASIDRGGTAFLPDGQTEVAAGDIVTLIADVDVFAKAAKLFDPDAGRRRRVIILGGTSMGVWLCRALQSRMFSVRLIEADRARAEELAAKLDWVTVLCADLEDTSILEDERTDQADAFVALMKDDESNLLAAAHAKSLGAKTAFAVLQRPTYQHLLSHVGIDRAFSPRALAVGQIMQMIEDEPVRVLAELAHGIADVYEVRVPKAATNVIDKPLRELRFPAKMMVAAIQRGDDAHVPSADDAIAAGDTVIFIGPGGMQKQLKAVFNLK